MSYADLYMDRRPQAPGGPEPVATVFGVPFDSTHSYRPGCRFGPDAIRGAFANIEVFHPALGADLEEAPIEDLGNARHTVSPEAVTEMLGNLVPELAGRRQVVMLGGEHSITYGSYTALPRGTGLVVLDAHYDLRDELAGTRLGHASFLRRIVEERGPDGILHVGARAFAREELEFLRESRVASVGAADVAAGRAPGLIRDHASTLDRLYLSLDLDVADPAFAPGVGNPAAAGATSREVLAMVEALAGARVSMADIVELNPYHDNGATAALAARAMSSVIAMGMA